MHPIEFMHRVMEYVTDSRFGKCGFVNSPDDINFMYLLLSNDKQNDYKPVWLNCSADWDVIKRQLDRKLNMSQEECSICEDFYNEEKPRNIMVDCIKCGNGCCEYCFFDILKEKGDFFVCPFCRDTQELKQYYINDYFFYTLEENRAYWKDDIERFFYGLWEKIEKERIEKERIEKKRIEKEKIEKERIEKKQIKKEQKKKERLERKRIKESRK